jgi:exoribonuclease R
MNSFPVTVDVSKEDINGAYIGTIVSCDIEYTKGYSIKGKITEVLGSPDDPGIEISEIALEYGFKMPFSPETDEE